MKSKRHIYWLAAIPLLAVALLGIQIFRRNAYRIAADFNYPFLAGIKSVENTARKSAILSRPKSELINELLQLQQENDTMRLKQRDYEILASHNAELRRLLALPQRTGFKTVFAELYLRDPLFWEERFSLNQGTDAGIREGAAVLCRINKENNDETPHYALVGKISDVSKHTAVVSTVNNIHCRFGILLPESRAPGIATGSRKQTGKIRGRIRYLPRDVKIKAGEKIYTSGLSDSTPPGLFLGYIAADKHGKPVVREKNRLYQEAEFVPVAKLDAIHKLIILVPEEKP